ncbi:MAG: helix-turn-helix transcriptional regulator [Halopenitus sp.]
MFDLTAFQRDILRHLRKDDVEIGLEIKEEIENERGETTNHGRLYTNLGKLEEEELIDYEEIDGRTKRNYLTGKGQEVVEGFEELWSE